MSIKHLVWIALLPFMLLACVSTRKFKDLQSKYDSLERSYGSVQGDLSNCKSHLSTLEQKNSACESTVEDLRKQNSFLKENNTQALKQLQDMSVISNTQAESIQRSLTNLGAKDAYIMSLQQALAHKDSMNMALVMNLKGAIGNLNDEDIDIKIEKGVVYINISDKLLFNSGSYAVTPKAQEVLGKVALVLKNQPDIEFQVEGNTDSRPYVRGVLLDNWDLSVKRATAVVRILQNQYGLPPAHMEAAGRSEYYPVATNDTDEGRALNRRTRIIILPQLDQFFKLLETK